MAEYLPPAGTKLPFNFTGAGYDPPGSTSVLFNFAPKGNFGILKAAINVMQPYWYTTHTYPKSCPKYVVGYGPGGVQIIRGRCTYGGIRDLQGIITGIPKGLTEGSLPANINAVLNKGQSDLSVSLRITSPADLSGFIGGHFPGDLPTTIDSVKFKGDSDLVAFLGAHPPGSISAYLGAHKPVDLPTLLTGIKHKGRGNLIGEVGAHLPRELLAQIGAHKAENLNVKMRVWDRDVPIDLPGQLHGWQTYPDLSADITLHSPRDLSSKLRAWMREYPTNLPASLVGFETTDLSSSIELHPYAQLWSSIRSWHRNQQGNLQAIIRMYQEGFISAEIGAHPWANLTAKVFPHPPPPLNAVIRGWVREAVSSLTGNVYGWQANDIGAIVGGHLAGNLGILLRGWYYEDIRNLTANLYGWQESDLNAYIHPHIHRNLGILLKGVVLARPIDFPAFTHGWQEGNLGVITKGGHLPYDIRAHVNIFQTTYRDLMSIIHAWQEINIQASIGIHQPKDIAVFIKSWHRKIYDNLGATTYAWDTASLSSTVATHKPSILGAIIKVSGKLYNDFQGIIHGWEYRHLGMILAGTHDPVDVYAYIVPQERKERFLNALIHGWVKGDLKAFLNIVYPKDLSATLNPVLPMELSAYLKVRCIDNLRASTHGWSTSDLGAYLKRIYNEYLGATINPITDNFRDLGVKIYISGQGYQNLTAQVKGFTWQLLGGSIVATYLSDMSARLFAIVPRNLKGVVHGWQTSGLPATLNGQDYPWNLTANVQATGHWLLLNAQIAPVAGTEQYRQLIASVHPWEIRNFPAYIFADSAVNLTATLIPYMQGSDLHASLRPKIIRLTTVVKIPTLTARDMSAIINYPCFQTGYKDLLSFIYAKYKGDLQAYIRPLQYVYKPRLLGASVGYTDSYIEVDKFKFVIKVLPSQYFVEDKFRIKLNVMVSGNVLSAYIRATPRYKDLSANIIADQLESYSYTGTFKNRERVIHKTYSGILQSFETVEFAFKNVVKEYYYSTDGNYAWRKDGMGKWLLDVRSILPKDLVIKLRRRTHRIATLSDLRKFNSVDEAMKYAIAKVTEWPEASLGAFVYNKGTFAQLRSIISPKYVKSESIGLSSAIISETEKIIVGEKENISTI